MLATQKLFCVSPSYLIKGALENQAFREIYEQGVSVMDKYEHVLETTRKR